VNDGGSNLRRHERASISLEVEFRTTGSFLVSYSLNLSKGGLFLDTPDLLPVGSRLAVRFVIPGADLTVETDAEVMWVRSTVSDEGLPPGMGLRFEHLEDRLGALIDRIVQGFHGMHLLAVASDQAGQERLSRNLRSILTAEVGQATATELLIEGFGAKTDLVLVDLDSTGSDGLALIQKAAQESPAIPVVALSRSADTRVAAADVGAQATLENPPPYEILRQCVLDVLGQPYYTVGE
jgi:type IV pilus assembly protein PilZ